MENKPSKKLGRSAEISLGKAPKIPFNSKNETIGKGSSLWSFVHHSEGETFRRVSILGVCCETSIKKARKNAVFLEGNYTYFAKALC